MDILCDLPDSKVADSGDRIETAEADGQNYKVHIQKHLTAIQESAIKKRYGKRQWIAQRSQI